MHLGCLSPSVIPSLEDFQLPNALSTPSYELRLLTTMEKHINTGIKILSPSIKLYTVTPISLGLSCVEDHGARGRPWNFPKVVAKLFLRQPLQDSPSQGMRHIWPGMTRPHTSADNAVEKDGFMEGHRDAGTKGLQ